MLIQMMMRCLELRTFLVRSIRIMEHLKITTGNYSEELKENWIKEPGKTSNI